MGAMTALAEITSEVRVPQKIAIVGAGWYGCHIGASLKSLGFDVTVFEQHDRVLHEASGNNQFRLHLGFHYPRHHRTRIQSRDGFLRFIERYPELSREVPENVYAVPKEDSLIDFQTYKLIMTSSGIDFREVRECSVPMRGIDGILLTSERVMLIERARHYFEHRLGSSLRLGARVQSIETLPASVQIDGERFDMLIDATWGHLVGLPLKMFYETTILLYFETQDPFPAVTLVDGPLTSVYPTEDPNIYTLSSVPHTPIARASTSAEARSIRDGVGNELVEQKKVAMLEQISRYLPDFNDRFRFMGPQLAIKTKPVGAFDDRSCYVYRQGRTISVMSGKIDTIFFAMEQIINILAAADSGAEDNFGSSLRHEIMARRV